MVSLLIASRLNGEFQITGEPSLAAQDDTVLIRQANIVEETFYQNMPETFYIVLVELMSRRLSDLRMRSVMARLTEAAGEDGVAAVLHHADGTKEATILHDDGKDDNEEPTEGEIIEELLSAGEMGIIQEDLGDGDYPDDPKGHK